MCSPKRMETVNDLKRQIIILLITKNIIIALKFCYYFKIKPQIIFRQDAKPSFVFHQKSDDDSWFREQR